MRETAYTVAKAGEPNAPIEVRGLRKAFGKQKVLDGVDLLAAPGETLVVLGLSGTGKSVLLKLILGLQKPESGSIRINGEDVTRLGIDQTNEVRRKVGFLFQQGAIYDSLTVLENVEFPVNRRWKASASDRTRRAGELGKGRPGRGPVESAF